MRRLSPLLFAVVCVNALAQTPAAAPPAGPIPLEHFTRHDEFGGLKISPDGEFVAMLTGKYGRSAILFLELNTRKAVSSIRVPDDCEIDEFHWISPTRVVYMIAQRPLHNVEPTATGEIFAINRDGRSARQLYGYRAEQTSVDTRLAQRKASYAWPALLSALKKDSDHILIAEYPWHGDAKPLISRLHVYSGKKRQLDRVPLPRANILLDHNDNARFAFGLNEHQRPAVSWKPEPGRDWTSFELEGLREDTITPRRFSADDRSVFLTGARAGESFDALYRLDLQTKVLEKVHAFDAAGIDGVIVDFADREIIGVSTEVARPSEHWLLKDNPAAQTYQALQRAFPNQAIVITSHSDDGRLAIVLVYSDVNPGEYYLFDTVSKRADFLRAARIWIEPKQMRPKEPFTVTARDGLVLHGYVTRAAGEGPHPMVVLPHGGPYGWRDWWEFDPEVQLLANRGYTVLQINYRGSGIHGQGFVRAGYREWGGKMQDDLTDATRWAIAQKIAPADRICIYGAHYGGYAALMGTVREPDLYRCAIGYAGIYDLELMGESRLYDSDWGRGFIERAIGTDVAKVRASSPVNYAQSIKVPVLLIHGTADAQADYEQARRMKAALEKNQKKVEWLALDREGDRAYDENTRREVYQRILQFLDANLSERPGTPAGTP